MKDFLYNTCGTVR